MSGTESADRVSDVLLLFLHGQSRLGVSEVARQLGLSKAVVHRILRSLESRHLVEPDAHRGYRLGPAAVALGARALRDFDLREVAHPVLTHLQHETRETTTLSALVGLSRVYLDQIVSPNEIRMTVEVGRVFPLYAGASGKVVLALAAPPLREAVLDQALVPLTDITVTDRRHLEEELATIADQGYAVSHGERQQGAGSVAAPIIDGQDGVVGSVSACGPVSRFDDARVAELIPAVVQAAAEITAAVRRQQGLDP